MKNIFKKLPQNARYNMLIRDIISSVIVLVIAYIIGIVINSFEVIPRVIKENSRYVFYIILALSLLDIILTQTIGYKKVKYSINEKSIEVYKGIYFISHEIVPIRRMQQININQGLINRVLKLSNIEVITSGGKVELKYILETEVEEIANMLRDKINEFVKEEKFDSNSKDFKDDING